MVTFTKDKFAAMAHIDDNTSVDSMTTIFDQFRENGVSLKDVQVMILGGWKEHPESFEWGQKILTKLKKSGFQKINDVHMYSKKRLLDDELRQTGSISELSEYYHLGAAVRSSTGVTRLVGKVQKKLLRKQNQQLTKFTTTFGVNSQIVLPLTRVFL